MKLYLLRILISLDQLANTILGGYPDATISGRMGRAIENGRCPVCNAICALLNKIDPGHCADAIEREETYRDLWDWGGNSAEKRSSDLKD